MVGKDAGPAFPFPELKKGLVIERTEQVEHHRWTPSGHDTRGLAPLDGPTRALLHQLRWRKAPPDRRRRWVVLGVVLGLHGLFALLTWHEMQWRYPPEAERKREGALQVRLIPRPPAAAPVAAMPPPPPLPVQPLAPPASAVVAKPPPIVHEAPAKNAMTVTLPPAPAPAPAPVPQLYDASGQPIVPAVVSTVPSAPTPGYVQQMPQDAAKVMQHSSPITYNPTRFEKDWHKSGGSSVDDALKKAVDSTTVDHTFHIAPGVRIHCAISFAALSGGCGGDPPPPPPSNDGDMRMSMAPASSLAPGTPQAPTHSIDECIAIYRAQKPLPYGCPIDTPTRSVDAEMQERANHQGDSGGH